MFIELVIRYPEELENDVILQRINKDTIKSHLPSIIENLI
jgi:hypothetical protein